MGLLKVQDVKKTLPVLPLKDIVVFPGMVVPLLVGREKSTLALEAAMEKTQQIVLVAQKNPLKDSLKPTDLYKIGVRANIVQLLKLPDGTVKILVEGQQRVYLSDLCDEKGFFETSYQDFSSKKENENELEVLSRNVLLKLEQYFKLSQKQDADFISTLKSVSDLHHFADLVISHLTIKMAQKQELLEEKLTVKRLEKIYTYLEKELDLVKVDRKIRNRVKQQMEQHHRDMYLNEQMRAIQRELGEDEDSELFVLEEKIKQAGFSTEAKEKALSELKKLKKMSPMSAEATVIRHYLDWLLDIPWKKKTPLKHNLPAAQKVLDTDHYGLEKVKERIIEYLAVQQKTKSAKGSILCFVGPPGVGKTSLGKSLAKATGRTFVRASLGGVRDEAEIRGHRRTYIGSMPGKIIQAMKKAKTTNPLILLDEIDKLGADWRGDPASALLEVLDPEQNNSFSDHYLEVDYDLSSVMFITTANTLDIPKPLLDRMEIIRISGYTEEEKIQIAKQHLISKQLKEHGLNAKEWKISDDALQSLIRYYTQESGVRELERTVAKLIRKAVTEIVTKKQKSVHITPENISSYLGPQKYHFGRAEEKNLVGVTTGLAWTEVGGDLLSIEAVCMPGKGKVQYTGNLKDVMKESIDAAMSFVRSKAVSFGIKPTAFYQKDIHIHVPEGATPKDGPSAGITMCTSIVSALTGIPVRSDIAMTGEITLQGRVLPIGGLKEKLLAALRGGIKTVLIPEENKKDLEEIPEIVKKGLTLIPVKTAQDVLEKALENKVVPIEWDEKEEAAFFAPSSPLSESHPQSNLRH